MKLHAFFRFSLRTLLLLVLTLASAATLWWNWGPWAPALTFLSQSTSYIGDGRLILCQKWNPDPPASGQPLIIDFTFHDPQSGRTVSSIKVEAISGVEHILPTAAGRHLQFWRRLGQSTDYSVTKLWHIDSGQPIELQKWTSDPIDWIRFSDRDRFALIYTKTARFLINMETQEVIRTFLPGPLLKFSPNGDFLLSAEIASDSRTIKELSGKGSAIAIFSLPDGKPLYQWHAPGNVTNFTISPSGDKVALEVSPEPHLAVCLIGSGVETARIPGKLALEDDCFSPSGRYVRLRDTLSVWDLQSSRLVPLNSVLPAPAPGFDIKFRQSGSEDFLRYNKRDGAAGVAVNLDSGLACKLPETTMWTANPQFALLNTAHGRWEAVLDARTGETLFKLSPFRWKERLPLETLSLEFAATRPEFLTSAVSPSSAPATLWRLRRPLAWFGPAYLPEFWLTTLFTLALFWSLFRDRKTLSRTETASERQPQEPRPPASGNLKNRDR